MTPETKQLVERLRKRRVREIWHEPIGAIEELCGPDAEWGVPDPLACEAADLIDRLSSEQPTKGTDERGAIVAWLRNYLAGYGDGAERSDTGPESRQWNARVDGARNVLAHAVDAIERGEHLSAALSKGTALQDVEARADDTNALIARMRGNCPWGGNHGNDIACDHCEGSAVIAALTNPVAPQIDVEALRSDHVRRLIKDALTQYQGECADFIKHPGPAADALIKALVAALSVTSVLDGSDE